MTEPAMEPQQYEPCVTGTDGRCTRWSHDHPAEPESRDEGARALREAANAARGMHDPPDPDCTEWADWLDRRADALDGGESR